MQRFHGRNAGKNDPESDDMKRTRESEHRAISKSMVQKIADQFSEGDSTHSSAESNQSGDRADHAWWKQVGGQNHDESRPGLLAKVGEAEDSNCERHRNVRNQDDEWHERSTEAKCSLSCGSK